MSNIFRFRDSTIIGPHGAIELQIGRGWEYLNHPVEIVLDELDFRIFEGRRSRSGRQTVSRQTELDQLREDIAAERWTYIGKIECKGIINSGGSYFFREEEIERGLAQRRDGTRQPIPFKLVIPTGPGREDRRQFNFWVTGEAENRYEVAIKINDADGNRLAPSNNTFMLACIRGRIVMPIFLEIVQPYFRNGWSPPTSQERNAARGLSDGTLAEICYEYFVNRLDRNIGTLLDGQPLYRNAEGRGREELWVRMAVEHMTGLPYMMGHLAYGGRASGGDATQNWRDYVIQSGEYPACNVCDQLGTMIQWIRGLPYSGMPQDYIRGGLRIHKDNYQRWARNEELSEMGAVYCDNYDGAIANTNLWAKPGASIFYKKIEWDGSSWRERTDAHGTVIGHESTIIRTRGRGNNIEVQLFDYGPNIQGGGPARGFVGNLANVAQESGWIPAQNALTLLDRRERPARSEIRNCQGRVIRPAQPARPASPPKFMAVGWRPPETAQPRNLRRPLGEASLVISRNGTHVRTYSHSDLHDVRGFIYPITHYINALSDMPHSELMKATIKIRSMQAFTSPGRPTVDLLDIETDPDGLVKVISKVRRVP